MNNAYMIEMRVRLNDDRLWSQVINLPIGHPIPRVGDVLDLLSGTVHVTMIEWSFRESPEDFQEGTEVTLFCDRGRGGVVS